MKYLAYIIGYFVILFTAQIVKAQGDVKIGIQVWTSKNLDVDRFRNGDPIPEAKSKEEWINAWKNKTAAFCYYNYDSKNGKVYGKLYNWYAVDDSRGLAPKGYSIPNDGDWKYFTYLLGGAKKVPRDSDGKYLLHLVGGEKIAGEKMKSTSGWYYNGNGNNSSGFNGLPGGYCNYYGDFDDITDFGYWWSSSHDFSDNAWNRYLYWKDTKVYRSSYDKNSGFSVRCIRD